MGDWHGLGQKLSEDWTTTDWNDDWFEELANILNDLNGGKSTLSNIIGDLAGIAAGDIPGEQ